MIAIGSDHAGFAYKQALLKHLKEKGYEVRDCGTFSQESCDYPTFAKAVCNAVAAGECEKGILICGTGIGMSIAANKQKGIRAAVCGDEFSVKYTRLHNDANVLCMGARIIAEQRAIDFADLFLSTGFEGGKHSKRIAMFED